MAFLGTKYGIEGIGPAGLRKIHSYFQQQCENGYARRRLKPDVLADLHIGVNEESLKGFYKTMQGRLVMGSMTYQDAEFFARKLLKECDSQFNDSDIKKIRLGRRTAVTEEEIHDLLKKLSLADCPGIVKVKGMYVYVKNKYYSKVRKTLLSSPEYKKLVKRKTSRNTVNVPFYDEKTATMYDPVPSIRYIERDNGVNKMTTLFSSPPKITSLRFLTEFFDGLSSDKKPDENECLRNFELLLQAAYSEVYAKIDGVLIDTSPLRNYFLSLGTDIREWYLSRKRDHSALIEEGKKIGQRIKAEFGNLLEEKKEASKSAAWSDINFGLDNDPEYTSTNLKAMLK